MSTSMKVSWSGVVGSMLVVSGLFACSGCSVLFPGHPNSNEQEHQRVSLQLIHYEAKDAEAALAYTVPLAHQQPVPQHPVPFAAAGLLAPLIPIAVNAIANETQAALEKEAAKYQAIYAEHDSDEFYSSVPTVVTNNGKDGKPESYTVQATVDLKGFILTRTVDDGDLASQFFFKVQPSVRGKGDAFRIGLSRVVMRKSRAKVLDASWRHYWWTRVPLIYGFGYDLARLLGAINYDETVMVTPSVKIEAVWSDDKQSVNHRTIADMTWDPIRLSLDGDNTLKLNPHPEDSAAKEQEFAHCSEVDFGQTSAKANWGDWQPHVPISYFSYDGKPYPWGCGTYKVTVSVTESDPFGTYVSEAAALVKNNKAKIEQKVEDAAVNALKK